MKAFDISLRLPGVDALIEPLRARRDSLMSKWGHRLFARVPAAEQEEPREMLEGGVLLVPVSVIGALTLLVVISAMMVIFSAYEYRRLFNQHQVLVSQWDELQVEWGQYLLEQSVWSSQNRIEALASDQLNMVVPDTATIEIVRHEQR